jgi:phage-related protein
LQEKRQRARPRLAKSAVFAAVTSKSDRLDQPVGAPIRRSPRFADGLVNEPAGLWHELEIAAATA